MATLDLLGLTVPLAACAVAWASINEHRLIFGRPKSLKRGAIGPSPGQHRTRCIELAREDELLRGWLTEPKAGKTKRIAFYLGGRNEDVRWAEDIATWLGADWAVCTFAYRGRCGSTGTPSERLSIDDAIEQLDWIRSQFDGPETKISLIGRSIGASLAVLIASELPRDRPVQNLVLLSPPLSVSALLARIPVVSALLPVLKNRMDCGAVAEDVTADALVLLAEGDTRVPNAHSAALGALLGGTTTIKMIDGTNHKTLPRSHAALAATSMFLLSNRHSSETKSFSGRRTMADTLDRRRAGQ